MQNGRQSTVRSLSAHVNEVAILHDTPRTLRTNVFTPDRRLELCGSRPETRPKMSLCCTYRETRDPVCFFEMKRVQNASRESQNESRNDLFVRKAIHSSVSRRVWDASFVLERCPERVPFILLGLVFGTRFNMRTTVGLGLIRHSSTLGLLWTSPTLFIKKLQYFLILAKR